MSWREENEEIMKGTQDLGREAFEAAKTVQTQPKVRFIKKADPRRYQKMSDAEVCAAANRDRAEDLGRYGMTSAMKEERRRISGRRNQYGDPANGIWDE